MFVTLKSGLATFAHALARRLPQGATRLCSPVKSLEITSQQRWRLRAGDDDQEEEVDAVVLAISARDAGLLLARPAPELAALLQSIPHATSAVALAGYRREQIADSLRGMGFVVPGVEGRRILSCSYTSQKFPGRAPPGKVLLRVFLGGANRPELVEQPDDSLRRIVVEELGELLRASGEPELFRVVRWRNTMPQYQLGHVQLVSRIESLAAQLPGLALAGNAYHGVGLPQCVESGEGAAARLCEQRQGRP
jgi:oxygen-dependent protoporphyrinogen oxidase